MERERFMTLNYNFIRFILLFFFLSSGFAQNSQDTIVSTEVKQIRNLISTNADENYDKGLKILKLAKSSKEYLYAYSLMGDASYEREKYSDAIFYLKKTDSLQELINDKNGRFLTNFFMTDIYLRVGLSVKAKESLEKVIKFSKNLDKNHVQQLILQQEALFLEENYDYCGATSKREQNVYFEEKRYSTDSQILNYKTALLDSYNLLIYNYLKCSKIAEAKNYLIVAENLASEDLLDKVDLAYLHFLNKAIYSAELKEFKSSKKWFDKALQAANDTKRSFIIREVLQERINKNIDDPEIKKIYVNQYNLLKKNTKLEATKIIAAEEKLIKEAIKSKENYLILLYVASIAFVVGITVLIRVNKRKKKKIKVQFERTIANLKKQNVLEKNKLANSDTHNQSSGLNELNMNEAKKSKIRDKKLSSSVRIMSKEKEMELLSKLKEFEKGKDFTEKNFTISIMAISFETNTKYINYILQQHRGKLFSDYINMLRIQYLSKLLYDNPEYLNYKISYLSDLVGYSSHSRFASIFKKEMGLSPSEFISNLIDLQDT